MRILAWISSLTLRLLIVSVVAFLWVMITSSWDILSMVVVGSLIVVAAGLIFLICSTACPTISPTSDGAGEDDQTRSGGIGPWTSNDE
jgi:hypothetical protein